MIFLLLLCSICFHLFVYGGFFQLGFTLCKTEQPLQGMELQEKKHKKRLQDTENLFRKNLQLKDF